MADVTDIDQRRRQTRLFGRPVDKDVSWLLARMQSEADQLSMIVGSGDYATKEARRIETICRRLAREAGYDLGSVDHTEEPIQ